MPESMEISDAAKSGDGSVNNVGIKMTGKFKCPDCSQKFDSVKAKELHWKFIHDPTRHQED
uniref:C2H2-type domain-containing protein n=1 Tax=Kryptoperidinium triquetrum TaxID=66468 RepID=A8I1R2_KRYTR|nr:unknown [Heterocapsa triquetra]